jgi:hypothetical protein
MTYPSIPFTFGISSKSDCASLTLSTKFQTKQDRISVDVRTISIVTNSKDFPGRLHVRNNDAVLWRNVFDTRIVKYDFLYGIMMRFCGETYSTITVKPRFVQSTVQLLNKHVSR